MKHLVKLEHLIAIELVARELVDCCKVVDMQNN